MADDDFDRLPADEKIARLRGALSAFADIQRQHGDRIISLSARTNLLKAALTVVLAKLAKASADPERFVMDTEKVLADVRHHLPSSSDELVAAEYDAGVKELFDLLRRVADPTGQHTKEPN
jgi:ABC-type transporter Mla subunit MlaD